MSTNDNTNGEVIQSTPTDPVIEKWYEHKLKEEQETPKRLEDASKALTGIISITLAIFLSVAKSSFENSPGRVVIVALTLWLLSLVAAFLVVFPFRYSFSKGSTEKYIETHQKAVCRKYSLLVVAVALYVVALGLLVAEFLA
jgi:hypothetical protein